MPKKSLPIQYAVGIEDMFICFMTDGKDTAASLPTDEDDVYTQTNIVDLGIAGNSQTFEKWASNQMIISSTRNTKYNLTYNLAGLSREILDKMQGIAREKGIAFNDANPKEFPQFAMGFIFPLNDGSKKARWYPRCKLVPAEESYKTLTEEMDIPDQPYVIEALPLLFNKVTEVDFWDGDETNATSKVTVEDFMNKVICDESQLETLVTATTDTLKNKSDGE